MATSLATGSMVLTLDAQQLTDGLQKAAKKTKDAGGNIADGVSKSTGGAFGGIVGKLGGMMKYLGKGGLIGVGLVAVLGSVELLKAGFEGVVEGVKHLVEKATEFKEAIAEGKMQVSPEVSKGINVAATSIERLQKMFDQTTAQIISALAPVFGMVADAVEEWLPRMKPVIDWLGNAISVVVSIGLELFDALREGISYIIDSITEWVSSTFEIGDSWKTIEGVVVGVLRAIAKVGAYAWDILKAGAGALAVGIGYLVQGFGALIDLFKRVVSLAKELPANLRPDGLDNFIAAVERSSASVTNAGENLVNWGRGQINAFGQSAEAVDRTIDGLAERARARRERAMRDATEIQAKLEYKPVAAVVEGSKEMASIRARFTTEGLMNPQLKVQQQQLEQAKAAVEVLKEIAGKVGERFVFGLI